MPVDDNDKLSSVECGCCCYVLSVCPLLSVNSLVPADLIRLLQHVTTDTPCTLLDWLGPFSSLHPFPLIRAWHLPEQLRHVILTFRYDLLSFLTLTFRCLRFRDRWISTMKCKGKQSKYHSLLKCPFYSWFYTISIKPLYFTSPKSDQATGHRWILLKSDIFLQNSSTTSASSSSSPSYSSFFQAQWTEGKWHLITGEQSRSSANYDPGSSVIISN